MTLRWVPGWNGLTEPEAVSYVAAVEAADGQELEFGVAKAINDFVLGCKNDGIWDAIKAICILAGARTLSGALVPLVGTAPTNFNFVAGDYDRETGLVGDGSTKYLDGNRNNNADPQNSKHLAVYITSAQTAGRVFMGTASTLNAPGDCYMYTGSLGTTTARLHSSGSWLPLNIAPKTTNGLAGISRTLPSGFVGRFNKINYSSSADTSQPPIDESIHIFKGGSQYSNARLAFYSIGESLDLALLDTRVTRLMNLITYTQTAGLPDLSVMDIDAAAYIGGAYRAGGTLS